MGTVTTVGVTSVFSNTMGAVATGGTIEAVLSDNSDSSYVTVNNTTVGELAFTMPNPVIPPGAILTAVTFKLRRSVSSGSGQDNPFWVYRIFLDDYGFFNVPPQQHVWQPPTTFTEVMAWSTAIQDSGTGFFGGFPDGTAVRECNPDSLLVSLGFFPSGTGAATIRLYRIETTWWYNERPVVAVTGPADPSTSSRPTVTWTYTDADGDPQRAWRMIVVEENTRSTAGFGGYPGDAIYDPTGAVTKVYDSGLRFEPVNQWAVPKGLENGKRYYAYVSVLADPVAGAIQSSNWAYRAFTVNVTGPAAPTFAVTPDSVNSRVRLVATESTTAAPHPVRYDIERSQDGGIVWEDVRGGEYTARSDGTFNSGVIGNGWDCPDRSNFSFANGLRIDWHGVLADYTPGSDVYLAGQHVSTGNNRAWVLVVRPDGRLEMRWSSDGGVSFNNVATSTVAAGVSDGSEIWFEIETVWSSNPWTVIFRKSTDGSNWSAIGTTVTGAGPAPAKNSLYPLELGGLDNHSVGTIHGTTYRLRVWNSSNVLVANPTWIGLAPKTTSFYDGVGNLWTMRGSAGHLKMKLDVYDHEALIGVDALYRARAYRDDTDLAAGAWAVDGTGPHVLSAGSWRLKDPLDPSVNMVVSVAEWAPTHPRPAIVTDGIEAEKAVVVQGGLRSARINAVIRTLDRDVYDRVWARLTSGRTLLIQGPLARQWYVQPLDVTPRILRAAPSVGEASPIRHAHEIEVQFVEVEAP